MHLPTHPHPAHSTPTPHPHHSTTPPPLHHTRAHHSPLQIATKFHYTNSAIAEKLTHHTTLEVLWTVFPTIVVLFIAIPSLTLIYSMDQQTVKPGGWGVGWV